MSNNVIKIAVCLSRLGCNGIQLIMIQNMGKFQKMRQKN